jgi:hypothetical protein
MKMLGAYLIYVGITVIIFLSINPARCFFLGDNWVLTAGKPYHHNQYKIQYPPKKHEWLN